MAAVVETHVQSSDAELHSDEEFEESEGDGDLEGSDEGSGEGSGEGDGEDDGEDDGGDSGSEADEADEADEDEAAAAGSAEGEGANANAGWAEAMAKVLGKATAEKQSTILQKNKDLQKVKEKEREEQLERRKQLDKKRSWEMLSRVKPDVVKDKEAEKALQRVATRGVVQLFNAVKKHQKSIDEKVKEVGGSERKKAKILSSVSKKDFIDVLRRADDGPGRSVKKEKAVAASVKQEDEEAPAWSVLKEDFMMGAAMKDWDKESDGEETRGGGGGGGGEEREEDSESD